MINFVTGLIAITGVSVFFVYYAWRVHALPLTIILAGALALAIWDFVQSIRRSNGTANGTANGDETS